MPENPLLFECAFVAILNFILWLYIAVCPVIVIRVEMIRLFRLHPLGLTFLNIVFIAETWNEDFVLRHELAHVRQQRLYSPLGMALLIFFHYLYLLLKHRETRAVYRHSLFEKEANRRAADRSLPLPRMIVVNKRKAD